MGFAMAPVFPYHSSPFRKCSNLILRIYFPVALYLLQSYSLLRLRSWKAMS
jgi:hypothetical protein